MKKLCRKSSVHPSPPVISDFLSFLPAAIFAVTAALSTDDKEVLAYLISCSSSTSRKPAAARRISGRVDHAPAFDCDCFMCYRRYWARWDSSPNRQVIHEVIEAYEDGLVKSKRKKERRKRNNNESVSGESNRSDSVNEVSDSMNGDRKVEEVEEERGSVRRFVSFVGEKIWNAWG